MISACEDSTGAGREHDGPVGDSRIGWTDKKTPRCECKNQTTVWDFNASHVFFLSKKEERSEEELPIFKTLEVRVVI